MESIWLSLLYLASSGLILLGTTEPALGLQSTESLPGQSQEKMELGAAGEGSDGGSKTLTSSVTPSEEEEEEEEEEGHQVEALQEMLQKLGTRELPAVEKRLSWVPLCRPWEPCAVRRGVHIGKRCSCPRSTTCNLVTLRCS